jgi:hypothetical protein
MYDSWNTNLDKRLRVMTKNVPSQCQLVLVEAHRTEGKALGSEEGKPMWLGFIMGTEKMTGSSLRSTQTLGVRAAETESR